MSKLLELEFNCRAPIVDAFVIRASQIPEIEKEHGLEGYDWIAALQDSHSHAWEPLCSGIDADGCKIAAKLDGKDLPISGISITESKKDLSDDEYIEEIDWQRGETPLDEFINSELIVSYTDLRTSGSSLKLEHSDYFIIVFTETKYSSYTASIEVDDDFTLHDLNLIVGDFDSDLDIAELFYGHYGTKYQNGDRTTHIESPILSVQYKDKIFPIEQDFTSYAPLFECYKFENGEFLPAEELSDFFNEM